MASVFTQIIEGKIPSYKLYEDDKTYAFLDIHPESEGHALVVPKIEIDKLYELPDDYYHAVMDTVKKLAAHFEKVTGERTIIKVVGTDVPHAHVHVVPYNENWQKDKTLNLTDEQFREIQAKLQYN